MILMMQINEKYFNISQNTQLSTRVFHDCTDVQNLSSSVEEHTCMTGKHNRQVKHEKRNFLYIISGQVMFL